MNIDDVYTSSSFLKAEDLQSKTVGVTIETVGTHTFNEGQPDQKTQIVLSFSGKEKKLGLNTTNAKVIGDQLGKETDLLVGKGSKLYSTTTACGGRQATCIRIGK